MTAESPPEHLPLAALFEPADRAQWQSLVATVLRKSGLISEDASADGVEAVLSTLSYDGVQVRPLYTSDDVLPGSGDAMPGVAPFVRGSTVGGTGPTGWDVRQRHAHPDPAVTREAVMADLENGVSSLWLVLGPAGLPLGNLDEVLRDVYLDLAPVVLDAGPDTEAAAEEFLGVIVRRGVPPETVGGNLGADPIGLRARAGGPGPDLSLVSRLAARCVAEAPGVRAVTVDATVHHNAGGSDADELGASLATGLAYLRELTASGLSLEQAFDQLEFRYAATADQFLTIAKFRAARRLWARVAQVCGAELAEGQRQHAVTSSAMMTRRDPWVNLLRTTLACFGAGVGGAASVTVQPFDAALGLPDGFSRRIARNTSSLLVMESHVARVIDPAGGSWYVERLTDDLANAAWAWFTEIEQAGGIVAALETGLVGRRLAATWARRADNLAHRRDPITGVSEFPNLTEPAVVRVPFPDAGTQSDAGTHPGTATQPGAGALSGHRYAEAYEALRDAADEHTERTGTRAAVFLAAIGPAAATTARAGFAGNLFQAGGLATPASGTGTDPELIATAFAASGALVACLASSDRIYAEHAAGVAKALVQAGATSVWLAGSPGDRAAEYAAAGVNGYVYTGVNALDVLRAVHNQVGITS
jgi:methylmalonyl-CoA mutase